MNDKTKKFFIIGIIVAITIISLIFFSFNLEGLFLLNSNLEENPKENSENNFDEEFDNKKIQNDLQGLNLNYKIIEKTILKKNISEVFIDDCPNEKEISFLIKNFGYFDLVRAKVIFPQGLKIFSCNNCDFENLSSKEEIIINVRVCKNEYLIKDYIKIVSSNADDLIISIN